MVRPGEQWPPAGNAVDVRRSTTRARIALSGKGLFAITVWGASFVATRVALESLNPFGLVALRLVAGTLLLAMIVRARPGPLLPIPADRPMCVFLGVVLAGHLLLQAYGLRHTTAIHTGWIIGFIPVMVALGAHLLGQQRLARRGWLGVVLGTGGVLLVAAVRPPDFASAHFGDLLQIVSCFTWTIYTLAAAGVLARNGALRVTLLAMGVAAVLTGGVAAATGVFHAAQTRDTLLALLFLGLVCSGIAYYCWFAAVREEGPSRVGVLLYFEPFVTLITARVLLREPITINALAGGLCVLAGVYLVSRHTRPRRAE